MVNRLNALMKYSPAAILMWDTEMTIIEASDKWLERHKFLEEDVIGKNHYTVFPDTSQRWRDIHQRCLAGAIESCDNDLLYLTNGAVENVKWEINPYKNADNIIAGLIMISEIITEKVRQNAALVRMHRELTLLNRVTDIATKTPDEFDMLENVCKAIEEVGEYQLVWFSYIPEPIKDMQRISPFHKFGSSIHYLDNFYIDLLDEHHRKGPTATSILQNETIAVNDLESNYNFAPWKEKAAVAGLHSSISIPLILENNQKAVFAIYSSEPNAFIADEIEIFERMRNEVVFAINNIQRVHQGKIAQVRRDRLIRELNTRNRSLEEFTYMVSHNLRAKVADLLGISTLVTQPGIGENEKTELINSIKSTSLKLDEIIRDLNSSLLVKGHLMLNTEIIVFKDLIEKIQIKLNTMRPSSRITIQSDFSGLVSVYSDQYYLFEALYQLFVSLSNIKIEDADQVITITSSLQNGKAVLSVADNYNKVLLKGKERPVFEIYRKLYHHLTEGGIKLFYAETIIENMGGKLDVNTDPDSHITFTIVLPLDDEQIS